MNPLSFLDYHLSFEKVQVAKQIFQDSLAKKLRELGIQFPIANLYIRIFKQEKQLEIWASNKEEFQLIATYPFTNFSGTVGPKNREGDLQIPEGFYQITHFNPKSKFHLSLKISYPNDVDVLRNKSIQQLGGDIYIHGGDYTVGCIPIGDENISVLYWLCVNSFAIHPTIPVHIFPAKMEGKQLVELCFNYPEYITFWRTMQTIYLNFQASKKLDNIEAFA